MAKQTPMIELGTKLSQSEVIGLFDKDLDGNDIIIVDDKEYSFEEIKKYFYGGSIHLRNIMIEE